MNMKNIKAKLSYIAIPIIVFLTATIGSYFTGKGMDWYKTINLPGFTPPGWFIGLVWTIIFILFAFSALLFYKKGRERKNFWVIVLLFLINVSLNIFWSYLFFANQLIGAAAFEAFLLGISVIGLIILIWPISKLASALLFPYAGWVAFATFLNLYIWYLN